METKLHEDGTLDFPAMPAGLPSIEMSDNARKVFEKRYVRRNPDGTPAETVDGTFWRVAYHVARAEAIYDGDVMQTAVRYYKMLANRQFFPNSPTFTGAGTPLGQLAACFVLPISDDMGRKESGIFTTLRNAALIQQTGGGNGFSFSRLRPEGSIVRSSAGQATGPIGFLRVYDHAFGEVAQGGSRRGANMAVLRVDHPDIEQFITCKTNENAITNFNLSVGITDAFMRAVEADADWDLVFPDLDDPRTKDFDGDIDVARQQGIPLKVYKTIKARDLFNRIVEQAHHNGEPGVLFIDQANRYNPVPHLYRLESTNPCGEQWLGPYENCCLGSINLAQHATADGKVDWAKLAETTRSAVCFLDNVIDANGYVPGVPQLREAAHRARRIGLGIMGLGDLMFNCGIRYGSDEGQEFAGQIMEFVRFYAMKQSIELAEARGAFPAIKGSIYDPEKITWEHPHPLAPYKRDWLRPSLDWNEITEGIKAHGIRNAAQTTIAPTGTIATVTGCEGYGCEPAFALAYIRHMNDNGKDVLLPYASPLFDKALKASGMDEKKRQAIVEQVMQEGTCQNIKDLPENIRNTFVVSSDIKPEEHVRMQAALQAFVDNSLSKTVNLPAGATTDDVAKVYMQSWKLGCKGTTVYVTGSRDKVVLETKSTMDKKQEGAEVLPADVKIAEPEQVQMPLWHDKKKARPHSLSGYTFRTDTPAGKAFITINESDSQPFEIFINTAKAGTEISAVSEAIGRLVSYVLRLASPVEPKSRLEEVAAQLKGIGGSRSIGFGAKRVTSLPDGLAHTFQDYLAEREERMEEQALLEELRANRAQKKAAPEPEKKSFEPATSPMLKIGDICPECGQATVINEEGCRKCYSCGYSEC